MHMHLHKFMTDFDLIQLHDTVLSIIQFILTLVIKCFGQLDVYFTYICIFHGTKNVETFRYT